MLFDYVTQDITSAKFLITAKLRANANVLMVGPPGVGKTAIAGELADEIGLPLVTLLGSTLDPTDVGGFPVVREDSFDRIPMACIRRAALEPVLLFVDELSTCSKPVEATLLRLVHDRVAGDVTLHPGTRIIAAMNPPEQAPGGLELSAPLVGRFSIFKLLPSLDEVASYFIERLGNRDDDPIADLAAQWGAMLAAKPDMLQLDPPQAAIDQGAKWGSPRDWERGLRVLACLPDDIPAEQVDALRFAALASSVGQFNATAFIGLLKLRDKLPTIDDICSDPDTALCPADPDTQIGALGLLPAVAKKDLWAAWIYAARLTDEVAQAVALAIGAKNVAKAPKKHAKKGSQARIKVLSEVGKGIAA